MHRSESTSSPPHRYNQALLVIAFTTMLLSGFLGTAFHWDLHESTRENRRLASFPDFRTLATAEWPGAFEAWFNDHFGFRNTYIHRYRKLMRDVGVSDYRVLYGRDDWLFLNDDTITRDFMGAPQPEAPSAKELIASIRERRDWLESRGIAYRVVIIPNKATIYPEYLPAEIQQLQSRTRREHLMENLPEDLTSCIIDMTPLLRKAKIDRTVFLKNDTHWNPDGAYLSSTLLAMRLRDSLPALPQPPSLESLERRNIQHIGDLAHMTLQPDRYAISVGEPVIPPSVSFSTNHIDIPAFLTAETLPRDRKPPFTVHNPEGKYCAVVFHDSFGERMAGILPLSFRDTMFMKQFSDRQFLNLVAEYLKPDIVIEQVVERNLIDRKYGAFLDNTDTEGNVHGL